MELVLWEDKQRLRIRVIEASRVHVERSLEHTENHCFTTHATQSALSLQRFLHE